MQASQCKLEGVNIDPRSSPVNLGGLKLSDSGDARTESSKKRRHWNMFGRVMAAACPRRLLVTVTLLAKRQGRAVGDLYTDFRGPTLQKKASS